MKATSGNFSFQARWADMDFNGHMKNTAYLDYAADSRMLYFKQSGFPPSEFSRIAMGPVVFKDKIVYYREVMMYDRFTVQLRINAMSPDGSKFHLENQFYKPDHSPIARVISEACWFNLRERKITQPPESLFSLMQEMEKTDDYREIITNGKE